MAELINVELEADLTDWTSTSGTGLSWSAAAGLAATDGGMAVAVTNTSARYGIKTFAQISSSYCRFRLYVDPNSLTMASADSFQLCRLLDGANGRIQIVLRYDGASYEIRLRAMDDAAAWPTTSYYDILDTAHYIEAQLAYASGAVASDATLDLWIDDVHKEQVAGLDIYDIGKPDRIWVGAVAELDAGTSGTFYVDEIVVRDDDTEIGAIGGEDPPDPPTQGTSPYYNEDGSWGLPPGSAGYNAIHCAAYTSSYVRGGQYWSLSLEWPRRSGTCLTYKEWCAQLQANGVNLLRVRLDGANDPYGPKRDAFEPPPWGTYNTFHKVLDTSNKTTYRGDQGTAPTFNGNWAGSNLERLVNACGSFGVRLWIAFFHSFEFRSGWAYHPWNSSCRYVDTQQIADVADRGFMANATAIFSNATAIQAAKNRLTNIIQSVGSTNVVAAWELCAEAPWFATSEFYGFGWGAQMQTNIRTKIVPWFKMLAAHVQDTDPHGRPLAITNLRVPDADAWSDDPDNYWNCVNEIAVATASIKLVGMNAYVGGYERSLRYFRLAQEYVGTANDKLVFIDQYHPAFLDEIAAEAAPFRPSKAIQWIGVVGAAWGIGSMRWTGFNESAQNVWIDGNEADPDLASVAGVSSTYASYVDWYAHRSNWSQRHAQCSSVGLDSMVASGNSQYVTWFGTWTTGGTKTLTISGMTNGSYRLHTFNWVTGAHITEVEVIVTTGTATLSINANQDENRVVGYLEPTTVTGTATATTNLSVAFSSTVVYATQPPVTEPTVVQASDTATRYELRIRGANGSEVARIGAGMPDPAGYHVGPFQYVKHVNSAGGFIWRLSGNHPVLDLLEENGQVEVWRNPGAGGWYRDFTAIWTDDYDYEYSESLDMTGYAPGPLAILDWSTVAWPAQVDNRSTFSAARAETAAKALVQYNVTADAGTANGRDLDWRGPFSVTIEADREQGTELDASCSRQPLLGTLQDLAASGGGDFDLVRSATDPLSWQFRWYHGQRGEDRTGTVRFAIELANMRNVSFKHRGSRAQTAAIVGGQGEGSGREIEVQLSSEDGSTRHREVFVNATEVKLGEIDALRDKGDRYLAENADTEVFTFDVAQTPNSKYGIHYCVAGAIGDLVTVIQPKTGEAQTHKLVEVTVAVHTDGSDSITIGTEEQ